MNANPVNMHSNHAHPVTSLSLFTLSKEPPKQGPVPPSWDPGFSIFFWFGTAQQTSKPGSRLLPVWFGAFGSCHSALQRHGDSTSQGDEPFHLHGRAGLGSDAGVDAQLWAPVQGELHLFQSPLNLTGTIQHLPTILTLGTGVTPMAGTCKSVCHNDPCISSPEVCIGASESVWKVS